MTIYIHWLIIEILCVDAIVSCGLFSKPLRRRRRHVRWTESPPVDLPLSPDRERDIIINRRRRERESTSQFGKVRFCTQISQLHTAREGLPAHLSGFLGALCNLLLSLEVEHEVSHLLSQISHLLQLHDRQHSMSYCQ